MHIAAERYETDASSKIGVPCGLWRCMGKIQRILEIPSRHEDLVGNLPVVQSGKKEPHVTASK